MTFVQRIDPDLSEDEDGLFDVTETGAINDARIGALSDTEAENLFFSMLDRTETEYGDEPGDTGLPGVDQGGLGQDRHREVMDGINKIRAEVDLLKVKMDRVLDQLASGRRNDRPDPGGNRGSDNSDDDDPQDPRGPGPGLNLNRGRRANPPEGSNFPKDKGISRTALSGLPPAKPSSSEKKPTEELETQTNTNNIRTEPSSQQATPIQSPEKSSETQREKSPEPRESSPTPQEQEDGDDEDVENEPDPEEEEYRQNVLDSYRIILEFRNANRAALILARNRQNPIPTDLYDMYIQPTVERIQGQLENIDRMSVIDMDDESQEYYRKARIEFENMLENITRRNGITEQEYRTSSMELGIFVTLSIRGIGGNVKRLGLQDEMDELDFQSNVAWGKIRKDLRELIAGDAGDNYRKETTGLHQESKEVDTKDLEEKEETEEGLQEVSPIQLFMAHAAYRKARTLQLVLTRDTTNQIPDAEYERFIQPSINRMEGIIEAAPEQTRASLEKIINPLIDILRSREGISEQEYQRALNGFIESWNAIVSNLKIEAENAGVLPQLTNMMQKSVADNKNYLKEAREAKLKLRTSESEMTTESIQQPAPEEMQDVEQQEPIRQQPKLKKVRVIDEENENEYDVAEVEKEEELLLSAVPSGRYLYGGRSSRSDQGDFHLNMQSVNEDICDDENGRHFGTGSLYDLFKFETRGEYTNAARRILLEALIDEYLNCGPEILVWENLDEETFITIYFEHVSSFEINPDQERIDQYRKAANRSEPSNAESMESAMKSRLRKQAELSLMQVPEDAIVSVIRGVRLFLNRKKSRLRKIKDVEEQIGSKESETEMNSLNPDNSAARKSARVVGQRQKKFDSSGKLRRAIQRQNFRDDEAEEEEGVDPSEEKKEWQKYLKQQNIDADEEGQSGYEDENDYEAPEEEVDKFRFKYDYDDDRPIKKSYSKKLGKLYPYILEENQDVADSVIETYTKKSVARWMKDNPDESATKRIRNEIDEKVQQKIDTWIDARNKLRSHSTEYKAGLAAAREFISKYGEEEEEEAGEEVDETNKLENEEKIITETGTVAQEAEEKQKADPKPAKKQRQSIRWNYGIEEAYLDGLKATGIDIPAEDKASRLDWLASLAPEERDKYLKKEEEARRASEPVQKGGSNPVKIKRKSHEITGEEREKMDKLNEKRRLAAKSKREEERKKKELEEAKNKS